MSHQIPEHLKYMKCLTVSEMKATAANLDVSEPIMVTLNGKPAMVISSYADYIRDKNLMESLARSLRSPLKT